MANVKTTKLFFFFPCLLFVHSLPSNNEHNCESKPLGPFEYVCNHIVSENQCSTFAVFHTNSYYSSLYNLSYYLGLNRFAIAEANGFSDETKILPKDQPLLIPIDCKCVEGRHFQATVMKTTEKGESFYGIAESLEGLTTCKAIKDKNVAISPWNLREKIKLIVPLRCACPTSLEIKSGIRLLISYPVVPGGSIAFLAKQFNTTPKAILAANKRPENIGVHHSLSILVPLKDKPLVGSLSKPREPSLKNSSQQGVQATALRNKKKRKNNMKLLLEACMGVIIFVIIISSVGVVAFFMIRKKKQHQICVSAKMEDVVIQLQRKRSIPW